MAQALEQPCVSLAGSSKGLLAETHLDYLTCRGEEIPFREHLSTGSSALTNDFFFIQALSSFLFPHRHKAAENPQLVQCCASNSAISTEYCVCLEYHHQKMGCEVSAHSYKTSRFSETGQKVQETE